MGSSSLRREWRNEINFTVTRAGLAGQLLGTTINHEKPDIEVKRSELLKSEETLKLQLNGLEETLLKELADATGNILENEPLLDSLTQTKAKSSAIAVSLAESMEIQTSLERDRQEYLPLAQDAARLFFVIADLHKVNSM